MAASKSKAPDDDTPKRSSWGSRAEFFLATLGFCVGIGAITRFPYLVMKNGGGAFLIPFVIVMILGAVPLFYLEVVIGQFSGHSALTVWVICPAFKGVGYTMSLLSIVVALYYMPFTWSTLYLATSLSSDVPWRNCGNEWNTPNCAIRNTNSSALMASNSSVLNSTLINDTSVSSPSEEFWNYYILGVNPENNGVDNIGPIRWQLALSHLFTWVIIFLCCMKGASTSGKVVYVTALLPYVLLLALLVRGLTLEGSYDGLIFFLKPDFSKLADVNVWIEASIQVFFQIGPCWGGITTFASFNHFNYKGHWDAVIVPVTNFLTAIFGGVAIFSTLGFMSYEYGVPISQVAKSGPGIAFVAYPEAIAQMPLSPLWAVLFFLMIMSVAVDSHFGLFETFVGGLMDLFPGLRRWQVTTTAVIAGISYLLSLILCTEGGIYIYTLLDWYSTALAYTATGFIECIIIAYIYGIKRFYSDIQLMFKFPIFNKLMCFAMLSITPCLMAVMGIFGLSNLQPPEYKFTNYIFPDWSIVIGWLTACFCFLPTPLLLIYNIASTPGSFTERLRICFSPSDEWVPNDPELVSDYRRRWYQPKRSKVVETINIDKADESLLLKNSIDLL